MTYRAAGIVAAGVIGVTGPVFGAIVKYTTLASWSAAGGGVVHTISFEDVALAQGGTSPVQPQQYNNLPGNPAFVGVPSTVGSGSPLIYRPSAGDLGDGLVPTSGANVLELTSTVVHNGIVRITFDQPVRAIAGRFIDIESNPGASATGFRVGGTLSAIGAAGASGVGRFFGIVSDIPFTVVDIELNPGQLPVADDVVFDDLMWAMGGGCAGDVNADGFTNIADFNSVAGNFGTGGGKSRFQGDLSGDGFVTIADFNILANDFGCGGQ